MHACVLAAREALLLLLLFFAVPLSSLVRSKKMVAVPEMALQARMEEEVDKIICREAG